MHYSSNISNPERQLNQQKKTSCLAFFGNTIRKLDKFGHPITMTYENESTFKSLFGGAMTILSVISIIAYLGVNLQTAISRS